MVTPHVFSVTVKIVVQTCSRPDYALYICHRTLSNQRSINQSCLLEYLVLSHSDSMVVELPIVVPLPLWFRIPLWRGVFDTTLCDKVGQWLAIDRWFCPGTLVSYIKHSDRHDIAEILLKVTLKTITLSQFVFLL